jgi:hypothetical protein
MQGDRRLIKPVLEKYFPDALEWSHNWTREQTESVIASLSKGRTVKAKTAAIKLLNAKLTERD